MEENFFKKHISLSSIYFYIRVEKLERSQDPDSHCEQWEAGVKNGGNAVFGELTSSILEEAMPSSISVEVEGAPFSTHNSIDYAQLIRELLSR